MDQAQKDNSVSNDHYVVRQTSMRTLIMWNISKAVKTNPLLDIQTAIRATQERLQSKGDSRNTLQRPEEQYLMCAILAWQRLGHKGCDSLYKFIVNKQKEEEEHAKKIKEEERFQTFEKNKQISPGSFISYNDPNCCKEHDSTYHDAVGPVVMLPLETKIVMRVDGCNNKACAPKSKEKKKPEKPEKPDKALMDKIDAACCMESACLEQLTKLDKETSELRTRAQRLARREAQRVELLERAEAAWKDLEMGYQRRLAAAEEKEYDMTKHIQKLIQERNEQKNACTSLAQLLKEKGDLAEKEQARLTALGKEVYSVACERLRLSEEAARVDAELAELQCKSTQLDRELQFKEEQVRGRLQNMENEVDCARALTYEAERTIHAELSALKDQLATVSAQLLKEDEFNGVIKEELEVLRHQKMDIVEDLEGCQSLCDKDLQKKLDTLNKKREELKELKEKVVECQCKMPVDEEVEVKRTASLVALCKCGTEEKIADSCSCSSLRTTLLTNLLSDLFGGLQSELGDHCAEMPCQLLKCLEDKHSWDKPGAIKNNLQKYFSKLLAGELDIAIATSIEKYHARWVGASCVDTARQITCCTAGSDGSADRVIEKRAQKLAAKLAEKLFQERADQLTAKAKEVLKMGPPPCECSERSGEKTITAVYPCFVKQPALGSAQSNASGGVVTSAHWRRTHQNVSQLKAQLEDLKKASIKKEDLKVMEENIVKMVQRSITETTTDDFATMKPFEIQNMKTTKRTNSISRSANTEQFNKRKLSSIKKKQIDPNYPKQTKKNILLGLDMDKPEKQSKKLCPSYAVNICFCGRQKDGEKKTFGPGKENLNDLQHFESKKPQKGLFINDVLPKQSSVSQAKPIVKQMQSESLYGKKKSTDDRPCCRSDVACFHKPPSNTSIDNLLGTLAKWKCDLINESNKNNDEIRKKPCHESTREVINKKAVKDKGIGVPSAKTKLNKVDASVSKKAVVNVSKGTELQNDLPVTTNSEYMGAINLEKSNENFCKCVIDTENFSKSPFLNSTSCNCYFRSEHAEDGRTKRKYKDKLKINKLASDNEPPNVPYEGDRAENNSDIEKEQTNITGSKENVNDHHVSKTSSLFPDDSEYCITFLGVTLKKSNSRKEFSGKENVCYNIHDTTQKRDKKIVEQVEKPFDPNSKNKAIKDRCNGDDIKSSDVLNTPQIKIDSCDCNIKYDEFKSLINNLLSKQHENVHKDEEDTVPEINNSNKISKVSCVCCNTTKTDESTDLEVNAFQLLKEHLRNKLDEFKINTCTSNCISSSDEEKLFSAILQRVRKIISECTLSVTCTCVKDGPSEGSWQRAYTLLQEYLKMKINRVQCLCQSSEEESIVLPNVLDKVCNFIDDDFKRLKDLCKCKIIRDQKGHKQDNNLQDELPEKDTTVNNPNDKATSKKSILLSQTTASQVSSTQEANNRLENSNNKKIAGINTSCHSHDVCKSNDCPGQKNTTESNAGIETPKKATDDAIDVIKQTKNLPHEFQPSGLIGDIDAAHFSEKPNNNFNYDENKITNCPYIGYTVECTCNGLLGKCSCSKSLSKNTENINNIWTALTSNKMNFNTKPSYIMNAVHLKKSDVTDTNKTGPKKSQEMTSYDANISVHDHEHITLKISQEKLRKPRVPSTAATSEDNASLEVDEPIDWRDCSSTQTKGLKPNYFNDGNWTDSLYPPYAMNDLMIRKKSGTKEKSEPMAVPSSLSSNCECNMVPMCHVKMLVDNIEKKLIQSKCTCDSLSPIVCPEHSNHLTL